MALQLGDAVSDGIRRTFTRTGGILFIGFLAIQLSIQTSINSALLGFLPQRLPNSLAPTQDSHFQSQVASASPSSPYS